LNKSIVGISLAVLASAFLAAPAKASSLYGDTVTCSITGVGIFVCNQPSATAGPGPEFTFGVSASTQYFSVDFGPSDVLLTVLADNTLSGTTFNTTDTTNPFTSANLISFSGFTGFSSSNVSFSGGQLSVDLVGTSSTTGATIDIGLTTTPEPGTAGLIGAGSLLLMFWMRPRKKA
jgi:hypothetical protein